MYKIVIIDDNPMLRRSLTETIPWNTFDCEVVGVAENGIDGWSLCKAIAPHVAICDIKMPGCTGIELLEKVSELNLPISVIFITGFQEFEYAQKAVRYGASDFLLKPIKNEDLIQAVKKALPQKGTADTSLTYDDPLSEFRTLSLQICLTVERNLSENAVVSHSAEIIKKINACQNIVEITEYTDDALRRLKQHWAKDEVSPLTRNILDHIADLYQENITLSQIAEKFFINPSYLSRLLKKETNMNFTEIVAHARIDRAKKFLSETSLTVTDISQQIGFSDYTYFSQVFKKSVGISPTEYRKSLTETIYCPKEKF